MTFKHLSIAIFLAGTLLPSCKKESATSIAETNEQAHKKETVFSQFLNSLDPLTEPQRKEAIRSFLSQYHSQNNKKNVNARVQDEYDEVMQYVIVNSSEEGWELSDPLIDGSTPDPNWYTDYYPTGLVAGLTKRFKWMVAKQIAGIWRVMSQEQFVTTDRQYPWRFNGSKHIDSYLLGVTSYVTWTETFSEVDFSSARYNAYSKIEGTLNFNFPGDFPSITVSVENVLYIASASIFP